MRFIGGILLAVAVMVFSAGIVQAKEKKQVAVIKTEKGNIVIAFLDKDASGPTGRRPWTLRP